MYTELHLVFFLLIGFFTGMSAVIMWRLLKKDNGHLDNEIYTPKSNVVWTIKKWPGVCK